MRKRLLLCLLAAGVLLLGRAGKTSLPASGPAEIPSENRYVALTFDDGPRRSTTEKLLDGLLERGASATFFVVGEELAGNEDLVERMKNEGHQIGNHTWSHVRLTGTPNETALEELGRTDEALRDILGDGDYWIRPPYGMVEEELEGLLQVPLVKWSVDPKDWESRDTKKVVEAIRENVGHNAIILLHDIYPTSVEAALQMVDALQAEGYWFVTVEELLLLNGVTPQPGVMYRSGNP